MPPAAFAAIGFTGAVAGGVAGSAAAAFTAAVVGVMVQKALVGMVIGAVTAALTGGDVGKGALFGAIGGAVLGGMSAWGSAMETYTRATAPALDISGGRLDAAVSGGGGVQAAPTVGAPTVGAPPTGAPTAGAPPTGAPTVKPTSFWNTEGGAGLLKGLGGGIKDVGLSMMKPDEEELSEIKLKEEAARREANQPGAWVKRTADINLPETWKNLVANIDKYKAPLQTQKPGLLSQGVAA